MLETPDHLFSSCSGYRDLRVGLNLKDALEDRAAFLRPGIKARRQVEYDRVLTEDCDEPTQRVIF